MKPVQRFVRLMTNRRFVLCDQPCSGPRLAEIRRAVSGERVVVFPPGWVWNLEDGCWSLSKNAQRLARKTGKTQYRRDRENPHTGEFEQSAKAVHRFPADVVCPRCGCRQTLDAGRLNVVPATTDTVDPHTNESFLFYGKPRIRNVPLSAALCAPDIERTIPVSAALSDERASLTAGDWDGDH